MSTPVHDCPEGLRNSSACPEYSEHRRPRPGWVLLFVRFGETVDVEVFFCPLCGEELPRPPRDKP